MASVVVKFLNAVCAVLLCLLRTTTYSTVEKLVLG